MSCSIRKVFSGFHFCICLVVGFSSNVAAMQFDVTSIDDNVDILPGDGKCITDSNQCTLRAAIQEANAYPGADNISLRRTDENNHRRHNG
jgi:hypothetical protein